MGSTDVYYRVPSLADRELGVNGSNRASDAAAAAEDLYRSLAGWIGSDGCHALFARARAEAEVTHPSLGAMQIHERARPYVTGVVESVSNYGDAATADAIQSMIALTIEILGRLIGVDMATNLIERSLGDGNQRGSDLNTGEPKR